MSLQLKKTDPKKSKFTLYVLAEDKKIEKKDRTINEPLQFYTGRDRALFEVVVNSVDKNTVTGYLSTPEECSDYTNAEPRTEFAVKFFQQSFFQRSKRGTSRPCLFSLVLADPT